MIRQQILSIGKPDSATPQFQSVRGVRAVLQIGTPMCLKFTGV